MKNSLEIQNIDTYVGNRIRTRRLELGLSQADIAEMLNVTFQQVQKYEKGANRVSAGKLYVLSNILKVRLQYFFDKYMVEKKTTDSIVDDQMEKYIIKLNKSFINIRDNKTIEAIIDMVRKLGSVDTNN